MWRWLMRKLCRIFGHTWGTPERGPLRVCGRCGDEWELTISPPPGTWGQWGSSEMQTEEHRRRQGLELDA